MSEQDQSKVSTATLIALKTQATLLERQLLLHNMINKSLEDGLAAASGQGARVKQMLEREYKAAGLVFSRQQTAQYRQATETQARINQGTAAGTTLVQAQGVEAKKTASEVAGGLKDIVLNAHKLQKNAHVVAKDLGKEYVDLMQNIQEAVGGNAQRAVESSVSSGNVIAKRMMSLSTSALLNYYGGFIEELDSSFRGIFKTPDEYFNYIEKIGKSGTHIHQLLQDLTDDQIQQSVVLGKALDLNANDVADLLQRTFARFGKGNIKLIQEIGVLSKRVEKETGIAAKVIGEQITGLITDTRNFANITEKEAARASASLVKVGLDYEDLGNMVSQFAGFENAASNVADLTTAFGMNLDAAHMMTLANEKQDQFLITLRRSFLATGRDVRLLTTAQKRLLAQTSGLRDVDKVEMLFNPEILDDMEALNKATGEVSEKDLAGALGGLSEDIERVVLAGDDLLAVMGERLISALSVQLAPAAGVAAQQMGLLADKLPHKALKEMGVGIEALTGLTGKDFGAATTQIEKLVGMFERLAKVVGSGEFKQGLSEMSSMMKQTFASIKDSMVDGFKAAVEELKPVFTQMSDDIITAMKKWHHGSMSPGARTYFYEGFAVAAKAVNKDMNEAFNPGNIHSINALRKKILAMPEALRPAGKEIQVFMDKSFTLPDLEGTAKHWRKTLGSLGGTIDRKGLQSELTEAIKGGDQALGNLLSRRKTEMSKLYEFDTKNASSVLQNMSKVNKFWSPVAKKLKESGYDMTKLSAGTNSMLTNVMKMGGIDVLGLMKIGPKATKEMNKLEAGFGKIGNILKGADYAGLSVDQLTSDQMTRIRKFGKFSSGQLAKKAMEGEGTLWSNIQDDLSERRLGLYEKLMSAEDESENRRTKAATIGKGTRSVTVDVSKKLESVMRELNKTLSEIKTATQQDRTVIIKATLPIQINKRTVQVIKQELTNTGPNEDGTDIVTIN